jgi:hypothetical protein
MAKIKVTPNRDDLPPHPIDGKLPPEGGLWTADQYTFRLIRDGDLTEVVDPPPEGSGDPQRSGDPPRNVDLPPHDDDKHDDKRKKPR